MVKDKGYFKREVDLLLAEIRSDKKNLRRALTQEKYERAAVLRDQLKEKQKNFVHFLANMDLSESTQ